MSQVPEAFLLIAELGNTMGIKLKHLEGLWVHHVDSRWTIEVNGHAEMIEGVPPYSAALTYNGWPAGILNPRGGIIVSSAGASEDAFCEAMQAAIGRSHKGVTP